MQLRPYVTNDQSACLAIFDGNTPDYFAAHERTEFITFLDDLNDPYFVVTEQPDTVVACGGFFRIPQAPVAILVWGMVNRVYHRQGIGSFLLWHRLDQISQDPSITAVTLQTTQHSCGFFERAGFSTKKSIEDGFGPGLHQYTMLLELDKQCRERIVQELMQWR